MYVLFSNLIISFIWIQALLFNWKYNPNVLFIKFNMFKNQYMMEKKTQPEISRYYD